MISEPDNLERIPQDALVRDKIQAIRRIGRILHAYKSGFETRLGISPVSAWILALLSHEDGLTQNDLMTLIGVDPSMITRIVKEMETKFRWIRRERDAADNRLMRVYLTDAGRQTYAALPEHPAHIAERLMRRISDADMAALDRIGDEIERAAKEEFPYEK